MSFTIPNPVIKVAIKVASKILKRKERNCVFKNKSLHCGATKKKLADLRSSAQYAQPWRYYPFKLIYVKERMEIRKKK
jgi:hypothetical protein